jgi:hypothetical protein
MALHLVEISRTVTPGVHAVLLLDQAGWHLSAKLDIPDNITLMPLPPKSPELNPVENIWQFIRDNWLSSRVFQSYDDIVDHCCFAWNRLVDQPWTIMSIGLRNWAHRSDQRDLVLVASDYWDPPNSGRRQAFIKGAMLWNTLQDAPVFRKGRQKDPPREVPNRRF